MIDQTCFETTIATLAAALWDEENADDGNECGLQAAAIVSYLGLAWNVDPEPIRAIMWDTHRAIQALEEPEIEYADYLARLKDETLCDHLLNRFPVNGRYTLWQARRSDFDHNGDTAVYWELIGETTLWYTLPESWRGLDFRAQRITNESGWRRQTIVQNLALAQLLQHALNQPAWRTRRWRPCYPRRQGIAQIFEVPENVHEFAPETMSALGQTPHGWRRAR